MRQQRLLLFFFIFLLAAIVFFCGMSRDTGFGPGGVLTAILATGGLPNPPGYQWMAILGHLWMKIPLGDAFFRLNTLGVLIAAGWAAVFSLLGFRIVTRLCPQTKGAWRWGLSTVPLLLCLTIPLFWRHIYFFERYLFANAMLLCLVEFWNSFSERGTRGRALAIGVLAPGLLWAHGFVFLVGMFISIWWVWRLRNRLVEFWPWIASGCGLSLFVPPAACALIAGKSTALLNWGNPSNWNNFVEVLTRHERQGESLVRPLEVVVRQLEIFSSTIEIQLAGSLLVVISLVLLALFRGRSPLFVGTEKVSRFRDLGVIILSCGVPLLMINFSPGPKGSDLESNVRWVTDNYLLTFFCFLSIYAFTGLLVSLRATERLYGERRARLGSGFVLFVLVGFSGWQAWTNRSQDFRFASDFSQVVQELYPQGSLVFTSIDSVYFPWFARAGDSEGPRLVHTELLFRPWYVERLSRERWFSESQKEALRIFLVDLTKYSQKTIGPRAMFESYLQMIDSLVAPIEASPGAFVIEIPEIGTMRYGFAGWYTKEPWGLGSRLFKTQSEVVALDWARVTRAREVLAGGRAGPQGFWVDVLARAFASGLDRRYQWISNVFPDEALDLQSIKRVSRP